MTAGPRTGNVYDVASKILEYLRTTIAATRYEIAKAVGRSLTGIQGPLSVLVEERDIWRITSTNLTLFGLRTHPEFVIRRELERRLAQPPDPELSPALRETLTAAQETCQRHVVVTVTQLQTTLRLAPQTVRARINALVQMQLLEKLHYINAGRHCTAYLLPGTPVDEAFAAIKQRRWQSLPIRRAQ